MISMHPPPAQVSPEWLTQVLREAGVLGTGTVQAVEERGNPAFNSRTTHLTLTYANAPGDAPRQLLMKRNTAQAWAIQAGADEVAFYQCVAELPDRLPMIVPCYAAAYDPVSGESYLLLQDLSATHRPPLTRDQQLTPGANVPPDVYIDQVVNTLAAFHAYWWEHPALGQGATPISTWCQDLTHYEAFVDRRRSAWGRLLATEGDWLPGDIRALAEQVLASLPALWSRYLEPRVATRTNLTLTHGDAYFANFLCPIDPANGQTYLVDWQGPGGDRGTEDLATLCATFWTPAQRQANGREERILRRYLAGLHAHGVQHYGWSDLLDDYRFAVLDWFLVPIQDCADGSRRDYWWPKLQCLAGAFRDLGCADLLVAPA